MFYLITLQNESDLIKSYASREEAVQCFRQVALLASRYAIQDALQRGMPSKPTVTSRDYDNIAEVARHTSLLLRHCDILESLTNTANYDDMLLGLSTELGRYTITVEEL